MQNLVNTQRPRHGWFASTIGQKQLVAVTGIGLSLFVLSHMIGNMLILVGPRAYNEYSHALISNPLIYLAEAGLVGAFVLHLLIALRLAWNNFRARDTRYAVLSHGDKGTSMIMRTLWMQGLLIFVFLILHLATFKYGAMYTVDYGQGEIRDLHKLILEVFKQPGYLVWYLVALVVLGFHLSHGVGSSLQSLGLHHPKYQKKFRCLSVAYALIVAGGFIVQPLYVYFIHQG